MKKLSTLCIGMLFVAFLAIIPGCEEDVGGNDCGGDLTANPAYTVDQVTFNANGDARHAALSESSNGVYTPGIDTNTFYLNSKWKVNDTTSLSISIYEATDKPDYYDILRPRKIEYMYSSEDAANDVAIQFTSGGITYHTSTGANSTSYFEITSRSAVFEDNGDSVATVEGLFCCTAYQLLDTLKISIPLQGNFSGKFKVN